MFELFLKNIPVEIEKIRAAIDKKDHEEIYQLLHKNKPNLLMVGLRKLEEEFKRLEPMAKNSDDTYLEELPAVLEQIEYNLEYVKAEIN